MDTTVGNPNEVLYRQLKAQAALTGRTIGDLVNEAIQGYLSPPPPSAATKQRSLRELKPKNYPRVSERISEEIDALVYGK